MPVHGNSRKNNKDHHLYAIFDEKEDDIFKYGISDKPVDIRGSSARMREQVSFLNRAVGWVRYFARIILTGIKGRDKARDLEDEYIDKYKKENGRHLRGNL